MHCWVLQLNAAQWNNKVNMYVMLVLVVFCFDKGGKRLEIYPFHKDNDNAHVHFSLVYRGKNMQYTNTEKKNRVGNIDFNNNKKKCFYNLMK